jgi:hypothetical protein
MNQTAVNVIYAVYEKVAHKMLVKLTPENQQQAASQHA